MPKRRAAKAEPPRSLSARKPRSERRASRVRVEASGRASARTAPSELAAPSARDSARRAFRAELCEAAQRVFGERGYGATKMTDIAHAAGVAVGTLYNYFPSKEEIFQEIFAARSQEFHTRLAKELPSEPLEQLRYLVEHALSEVERHGAFFATFAERGGITEIDIGRLGGEVPEREYERFLRLLEDVVRAGVKAGALRSDISPRTLVAALSGAMNGVSYLWMKQKRRGSLAAFAPSVIDVFLAGARAAS